MPRNVEVVNGKVEVIRAGSIDGSGQRVVRDQFDKNGNPPACEVTQQETEIHPLAEGLPHTSRSAVQKVGVRHP